MLCFSSNMCSISDRLEKAKKKIFCRINKVSIGVYVTSPPLRFIRKQHNYAYFKKTIIFVTYVTTHETNGLAPKMIPCRIHTIATGIYVTTPPQYCNILINKKNVG